MKIKKILPIVLILLMGLVLTSCAELDGILEEVLEPDDGEENVGQEDKIDEDGHYTSKEDVALYLHTYDKLPDNFIRKNEAMDLGWESSEGNLWEVTDKKSIGGDSFGNREKLLPIEEGRQYYECDIDYEGGYRGAKRIVYSHDGLIYYTDDHYESFNLLYGDD